jgi:hypothetical protein
MGDIVVHSGGSYISLRVSPLRLAGNLCGNGYSFYMAYKRIEKRISDTEATYGKITEYRTEKSGREYYHPVVEFETEEGELISSVYAYPDKEKRYEIGDEELIRYTPDDPMFFYFANREKELTDAYYKCIIIGGFLAAIDIIAIIIILCI